MSFDIRKPEKTGIQKVIEVLQSIVGGGLTKISTKYEYAF